MKEFKICVSVSNVKPAHFLTSIPQELNATTRRCHGFDICRLCAPDTFGLGLSMAHNRIRPEMTDSTAPIIRVRSGGSALPDRVPARLVFAGKRSALLTTRGTYLKPETPPSFG